MSPKIIIYISLAVIYSILFIIYAFTVPNAKIIADNNDILLTLDKFNNWINETSIKIQNPDHLQIVPNLTQNIQRLVFLKPYPEKDTRALVILANGTSFLSDYNQTFVGNIFLKDNHNRDLSKIDIKIIVASNISK